MAVMANTEMGLDCFYYSYYPSFYLYNNGHVECENFNRTVEYLEVIKREFIGLMDIIYEIDTDFNKESLLRYLRNVSDSILLDVSKIREKGLEMPKDNLFVRVNEDYVMFSVYDKYRVTYENEVKPMTVIMSRSLKNLEFYFIERIEDKCYVANYKVDKEDIKMFSAYFNVIDKSIFDCSNKNLLELKKRLR